MLVSVICPEGSLDPAPAKPVRGPVTRSTQARPPDRMEDSLFSGRGPAITDLTIGAPGPEILAGLPAAWAEASAHRLQGDSGGLFQYGPEAGAALWRAELARFLSRRYGDRAVAPADLLTTCGATSGLQLAATVLLARDGVVFVEDPTYFLAVGLLAGDLGLRVVSVGMDGEGLDLHQLEKVVVTEKEKAGQVEEGRFWGMVYTIPNYHNPTGLTMSRERGRGLIQLAARHNMLVLCDDVYNLLSYSPAPYSRLRALEEEAEACVLSNGSLSKVLAPGVRLGWIEAPPSILARLAGSGLIQSGGCMNQLTSVTAASLVSLGLLDTQLESCLRLYSARMDGAVAALRGGLPPGWRVAHPGGGYFLWVTGPGGGDLSAFCRHLLERGVAVLPGARAGATSSASFRLSVAHYGEGRIVAACRDIAATANSFFQPERRA